MKQTFPASIREDTLSQCWTCMDTQRRRIFVRSLIAKLGGFFSNLTFLFFLLFAVNGLILRHFSGSYCTFLRKLSFFITPWNKLDALLPSDASLETDLLRVLGLGYLAGILVFVLIFLIVSALYHPKKRPLPTGNYEENATSLAKLTQETWTRTYRTHISSSVVSIVLVIAAAFALFFGYAFYLQDADAINAILGRYPTGDAPTNALIYVLFGYFLGHFLCLPLILVTRPLYYCRLNYALVAQAETAALFAGEPVEGMTEEALSQHHRDNAIPLREEAIRAEEKGGYRIAMELFFKAALGGDVPAMEHCARHYLLDHHKDPARYWLDRAAASGKISPEGKNMLLRLKLGLNHNLGYLQDGVDSSLKARRRRSVLQMVKNVLSLVLFLGLSAAVLVATVRYFGGDEASLMQDLKELFGDVVDIATPAEDSLPGNTPLLTLTEVDTPWEGACIAYDDTGAPWVSCYQQDLGGSLSVPFVFPEGEQFRTASVYFGNVWDVRVITKHVSYDSTAQAVVIAEDYLMRLEPGEYFILLNGGNHYIPLLVRGSTAEAP